MKKICAALALAGSIALAGAVPAVAAQYPAPSPSATVSDATVAPGEPFVFSGEGFLPGETIVVTVDAAGGPAAAGAGTGGAALSVPAAIIVPAALQTMTTTANAQGEFSVTITLDQPGTYVITGTGQTSGRSVSATVTVVGAAGTVTGTGATGGGLADTGLDPALLGWSLVGAGAVAAGAAAVVVARRRTGAVDQA
ncbi:peptidase [Sinomonas halotolerans]|uniref:Peptidase n=1 Tax=Sinomonas halotolerans TaxID=1644133 RepID=A0ABU9X1P8_9MICC